MMKNAVFTSSKGTDRFVFILLLSVSCFIGSCQPDQKSRKADPVAKQIPSAPLFEAEGELFILRTLGDTVSKLSIEIADSEFEQERGLMYRHYLPEESGMFFIFPDERYRSFWMKNTHIPLDILYIDKDMVIRTIRKNTVPFSEASVPSDEPAQFVLEVNAGYCEIHGIEEGMQLKLQRFAEN